VSEPVKLLQVWQYGPSYYRAGRFQITEEVRRDFWRCVEITWVGEERLYHTHDILSEAALSTVQVSQEWLDPNGNLCRVDKPINEFMASGPRWAFTRNGLSGQTVNERTMLSDWSLLAVPPTRGKDKCPLCAAGGGFALFNMFECVNSECRNYFDGRNLRKGKSDAHS